MRAIKITLRPQKPTTLPLAYNPLVQGLLYKCWRSSYPELHDEGFGSNRTFRLFTFGPLTGKRVIDASKKTVTFSSTISFEVRSPIEDLLDELARQLCKQDAIRLGANEMDVSNLQSFDRLLFPKRAVIRAESPVVAYKTTPDRHTRFFSPLEQEWGDLITGNANQKADLFSLSCNRNLAIIPRAETLRKHVTTFKGTYVTGWTGEFIFAADPLVTSTLYYTGLGSKNSQGFGMFRILDERP